MKFLCPSCKTKYQIADEKVAGRAVRMKCRKCGFVIPISEVPPAPPTIAPEGAAGPLPAVPKAPAPPRGLEPPPSSRPSPRAVDPSLSRPAAVPKQVLPPSANPAMRTARGMGGPAPGTSKMPAPAIRAIPKVAPAAARTPARSGSDLLSALDDDEGAEEQPTTIAGGGALAAAFGALVTAPKDKPATDAAMPADEWYVGINDVVVGPIRLGELRAKAASGAVQGDSLVWRDGLEDWRPLKTFPELVAVVEESLSSVRASAIPFVPPPRSGGDFGTPLPTGNTGVSVVTEDLAAAGLTRQKTPLAAWLAIAMALACGVAIGAFFLKGKPPETIVKYVDRPVPGAEQPAAAAGANEPAQGVAPGADSAGQKPRAGTRTGVKPVAATNDDKGGGLSGLKGLDGLRPGGPAGNTPSGTTGSGSSGGGQLDAAQTSAVVSRYTGSVKRSCWQPALDARDPTAPSSARVMVTITVGPSGSVQNATTSGDPRGYPGLANCIAGRVRGWQFPATGGTTTVNVPFVFAAQ